MIFRYSQNTNVFNYLTLNTNTCVRIIGHWMIEIIGYYVKIF